MAEFFSGWKRKVGVATLVLACLLAIGWLRSLDRTDRITIRGNDRTVEWMVSTRGNLEWQWFRTDRPGRWTAKQFAGLANVVIKITSHDETTVIQWNWAVLGMGVGEFGCATLDYLKEFDRSSHLDEVSFRLWRVPYWPFVVSLTALSSLLLLSGLAKSQR